MDHIVRTEKEICISMNWENAMISAYVGMEVVIIIHAYMTWMGIKLQK